MDTERFECFLALADILNYTTAAAALHKSQSVLSRQISSLEEELGFELFIRDSKQVSLTNAGRRMREGIRSLQSQYSKLLDEAREISEGKQGHLTLAVAAGETNIMFRSMLEEYYRAYPDIAVDFITYNIHDISSLLSSRAIDFVFTVATNPWFSYISRPEFSYVRVGVRHDYLYIPKGHPLAGKSAQELTLSDFKDDTFLVFDDFEVNIDSGTTHKTFSKAGIVPKCRFCGSLTDAMAGMQSGQYVYIGSNRSEGAHV